MAARSPEMVLALTVTVVLNGMIVPSFAPAQLAAGRVVAPLQTILTDLAGSVSYEPGAPTLSLVRDGRRIVAAVVFVHDGTPYALLGPIVRDLGGSVQFDARTKTLAIEFQPITRCKRRHPSIQVRRTSRRRRSSPRSRRGRRRAPSPPASRSHAGPRSRRFRRCPIIRPRKARQATPERSVIRTSPQRGPRRS